ncbi:MAG: guanylate kinase [Pseudomonadota bacterium]
MPRRGLMLVLSSPSGAGKTTLARKLLAEDSAITLSVSVTTRAKRSAEVDGRDYHFIDAARFTQLRNDEALLEWAEVFGNHYGTPRADVEAALTAGRDVLFDIDWQGTQQLAQRMPADLVRIFILPPSASALAERLSGRAQDSATVIAGRMAKAGDEISHWAEYDYVIINRDVSESFSQLKAILDAERQRRGRQVGLSGFVRALQDDLSAPQ